MGDLFALLNGLNLSPINTLLLGVLLYIFKLFDGRLKALESANTKHGKVLAVVRDRLGIEEDDD